jgi:hypothetical protein
VFTQTRKKSIRWKNWHESEKEMSDHILDFNKTPQLLILIRVIDWYAWCLACHDHNHICRTILNTARSYFQCQRFVHEQISKLTCLPTINIKHRLNLDRKTCYLNSNIHRAQLYRRVSHRRILFNVYIYISTTADSVIHWLWWHTLTMEYSRLSRNIYY